MRLKLHIDAFLFIWLKFTLHWVNRKDLSGLLLLHCEVELHRIHTNVLQYKLVLLGLANSDSLKIKDLLMTEFDVKRYFESLCSELYLFRLLLNVVALSIFNFECNLRVEFLLFLCSECNFN